MSALDRGAIAAIHATAIAIDGRALLIRGPSRSGKSRLALKLIAASVDDRLIRLIGDDRILLAVRNDALTARAHPRIAGFIERRGLGIVTMPHLPEAALAGVVELVSPKSDEPRPPIPLATQNLPALAIVRTLAVTDQRDAVLAWWSTLGAAPTSHMLSKPARWRRSVT